ncbi:MAG: TonB-dependent receptor plug domain-containing protein [Opitutaceae bacterium]
MNRRRFSYNRNSSAERLALAALLAIALIPATLPGQTASAPPVPPDQTPAPANQPPVPVAAAPAPAAEGETVTLSPFEVNAQQAKGYFTPNTTTGTRLANNIGDIPSAVTVIDRQQIENTNSTNINDIMMYEAGTEGSHTYTPYTGFTEVTRLDDALAGSNDSSGAIGGPDTLSTRINGLGAPDNETDNFFSLYRLPFDTYNVQSIEIDRGPDSLMFGSGSAAGIVNSSSAEAQLDKLTGDVSLQAGSFGGFRETADLNVPLIRNHVALYLAQEYTSLGMQRKPSSDLTRRQYAAITIDPFKSHKTKLTAYAEFYNNYANDQNTLLPVDYVTPWLAAGKPEMNPITGMVTFLATGKQLGPYVSSTTSPGYVAGEPTGTGALTSITSPLFVPGMTAFGNHFTEMYANGHFLYGFQPQQTIGSNYGGLIPVQVPTAPLTASQALVRSEFLTDSQQLPIPGVGTPGTPITLINGLPNGGYASYQQPGAVDQNIYNAQTGPNIDGSDYTKSKARTYHVDFQQNILSSSRFGTLDLDVGFFRQEYHDVEMDEDNQHANGGTSAMNSLLVDTNAYLLNGAPNTYAGSDFIEDYQGDGFEHPENNQNWRAMLTYSIDLRDKLPKWLQWIGHHRFMAEASTHDDVQQTQRLRTVIDGGDGSYTSELYQLNNQPAIPGNWNIGSEGVEETRWQYMSPPGSVAATQQVSQLGIPTFGGATNVSATTYNYYTGQWVTSALTQSSPPFNSWAIAENVQDQKTYYWQSFFWNDRIIGSVGLNDDVVKNRSGGTIYNAIINGVPTATSNNNGLFSYVNGQVNPATKYYLGPWNPTSIAGVYQPGTNQLAMETLGEVGGNTYSEGFVVKPFENWSGIDAAANNGNIFAGFLRTLGMTFNKADNFNPPTSTYTDLLGNPLGKPEGTEKDYGLEIATPDKKLYFRMTWFRSSNENNTVGVSQTYTDRELYIDQNEMKNWARSIVDLESGENPTSTGFDNQTLYPLSTSQFQAMSALTGMNANYLQGLGGNLITGGYSNPEATNTTTTGGYDAELTYNPLPNWTMKFTASRQWAELSSVDSQAKAYQALRMPIWTTAVAPAAYSGVYTNWQGKGSTAITYLGSFWNSYGYSSNATDTGGPNGGPQTVGYYYTSVVTIPITVEEAAQGSPVPEETEYNLRYLTDYTFTSGPLKNLGIGGGLRWSSPTIMGYYGATQASLLNASGQIAAGDLSKPIYTPAELHVDAWLSYGFKLPWEDGKIKCTVQLNCVDLTSNGYILPLAFNLDGTPDTWRIIPPRQWSLTTRFSF